jgi:hypothetical protein
MNECFDYKNDPQVGKRRIVCAAIKNCDGRIICGARHYDDIMRSQITNSIEWKKLGTVQGFIDQWDNFLTREDALIVALAAGQVIKVGGGFDGTNELFSENLY